MPLDSLQLQEPPIGNPESNLIAGMAAPVPQDMPAPASMPDTSIGAVALQEPPGWSYDFNPATGSARATFTGEVAFTSGGSGTSGVTTFNTRSGAVTLLAADVTAAGGAPLASPTFTGTPAAPTAAPGTSTTQIATTQFVGAAIAATPLVASFNGRTGAVTLSGSDVSTAGGALANNAALTGTPTAPTAAPGTQTGQLATTQFVANAIGGAVVSWNGRTGAVTLNLSDVTSAGGAPLSGPGFTGIPTAPTATAGTATAQLATCAFVTNAVASATAGVSSFNTRTGAVTLQAADVSNVGGALLNGPAFVGVPTSPTATAGTNTTQIATTAFVATAIANQSPVVATFNGRSGTVTLQAADVTGVGGALLASPTFTGTPAAPTPTAGDSSTRVATTAFVASGFLPLSGGTLTSNLTVNGTLAAPGSITNIGGLSNFRMINNGGNSYIGLGPNEQIQYLPGTGVYIQAAGAGDIITLQATKTNIQGCVDASNAPAGSVGEYIEQSGNQSVASGANTNIFSWVLTAGDWDVHGIVGWAGDVSAVNLAGTISTTSGATPGFVNPGSTNISPGSSVGFGNATNFAVPFIRLNLASSTTIYFVGQATYSGGASHNVYGRVMCRRVR